MRADLRRYLGRTASARFVWGQSDCLMWSTQAVAEITRRDPAARWRGAYSTAREAVGILQLGGGTVQLLNDNMRGILPRNDMAKDGLGVVQIGKRQIGALIIGGVPWLKADGAAVMAPCAALCAWGV